MDKREALGVQLEVANLAVDNLPFEKLICQQFRRST